MRGHACNVNGPYVHVDGEILNAIKITLPRLWRLDKLLLRQNTGYKSLVWWGISSSGRALA